MSVTVSTLLATKMMQTKRLPLWAVLLLWWCCFCFSEGLPYFGTRGRQDGDDEDGTADGTQVADAEVVTGKVEVITTQTKAKNGVHRQEFVEVFFQGGSVKDLHKELRSRAHNLTQFLVGTRRTLHRQPELMYQEVQTSILVQDTLRELGIDYTTGWAVNTHQDVIPGKGGYGIVADIGTSTEPCVLLRADIDALPILEKTEGVDGFKSRSDGRMHACGHDGHTTMLLGAAALLKDMEDSINGTVRIMFQPAEEGGAGAKRMREEGILQKEPKPQYAFGMHVWPT